MMNSESPIKDFYPSTFEQDMNGKKAEWEAIVKIPFIDAKRLLAAMKTKEKLLTEDEKQRNSFGDSYKFTYDPSIMETYPSSLPGFFPDLLNSHCKTEVFNLPTLGGLRLVKGLCDGVLLGKDALPGFPSLYTLPVHPRIAFHAVNVFQTDSRNESVIVSIEDPYQGQAVEQLAAACLGKHVFAGWPFLLEAKVVAVSDSERKLTLGSNGAIIPATHTPDRADRWRKATHKIEHVYSKRFGVILDGIDVVLHVQLLQGLNRTDDGALVKEWDHEELEQAIQTVVMERAQQDSRYIERPARPVEQEYPVGEKIFFLGERFFGCPATIYGHQDQKLTIQVAVSLGLDF
jgi:5'-3' exoribonuclease 1